ncbi:MAG: signal transduction histidine kinase [Hydrogenophaga sp.]|jgi:signal transduction histidine kinase
MPWLRRARQALGTSIKLRLVVLFLLLAAAMTTVFVGGAQKAFSLGWREAARPLLMDYVDHLVTDITAGGATPSEDAALALAQRLPLTVRISGPQINWSSHPEQTRPGRQRTHESPSDGNPWDGERDSQHLLQRTTADGHTIEFGINGTVFESRPRWVIPAIVTLLLLTWLAWWYVRRLLRPLDAIRAGAQRFGAGEFGQPIPVQRAGRPDELGQLAATINTMGHDIHQMLDAKRALLLAISHELRSPLTRARLNTELLPETDDIQPQREALLRDLQEMASLISGLLESERLSGNHAALQRELVDLAALAHEVVGEVLDRQPELPGERPEICMHIDPSLIPQTLDPTRIRLLVRNLLDNALRHSAGAAQPPELHLRPAAGQGGGVEIEVRDHGPGVPDDQLPHLAQAFYRPESARTRATGGVGLGLYLCKRVAQAHGGTFAVRNARPGLAVLVTLPGS